jgi:starch-binding outer membrane protein SusE/F
MKKILNALFFTSMLMLLMTACRKSPELTYLKTIDFPPSLAASTTSLQLTDATDDEQVIQFNWPAVKYDIEAPVTYTLQFALPSDTAGATAWANAKDSVVGADILQKGFAGVSFNDIAINAFGLPAGTNSVLAVRVKAFLDRPVYSNVLSVTVNPHVIYVPPTASFLYVPGAYQGWSPAAAPVIVSATSNQRYEGYINVTDGGGSQFKMTPQADWTPTAYGDASGTSGDIIVANYAGGNMSVGEAGYYELTADLITNKWTATKTTWGILGDATPGGWDTDTQLSYDATNQVWKVTCNMKASGSFKFRANNAWVIDFGIDGDGKLQYADNPFFGYTPGLNNLSVPADGNYTITLDLHDASNYTYILHKN